MSSVRGPDPMVDDELDQSIAALIRARAMREPPEELLGRALARVRVTPQDEPRRFAPAWRRPALAGALVVFVTALLLALVFDQTLLGSPIGPHGPQFSASGVSFDYPATWRLEPVVPPKGAAADLVAAFSRGLPACAALSPSVGSVSGGLADVCPFAQKLAANTMVVMVARSLVGAVPPQASALTIAGQHAWFMQTTDQPGAGDITLIWAIAIPGRQLDAVLVMAQVRGPDFATMRTELQTMLSSMNLSAPPQPSPSYDTSARYPGGIPEVVDGQPVYLGLGAAVHAIDTRDATPFLIGGWFDEGLRNICTGPIGGSPAPLSGGCGTVVGGNAPWTTLTYPGNQGQMDWNGHHLPDGEGPSIVRVHVHDKLAASCSATSRPSCEQLLVVDEVVWAGDSATRTTPLSIVEAARRFGNVQVYANVNPGPAIRAVNRYLFLAAHPTLCPAPWPVAVFDIHGDPRFGLLAVFPDAQQRQQAEAALDPSSLPSCGLDPHVLRPSTARWVAQSNVLALVFDDAAAKATSAALSESAEHYTPPHTVPFMPATFDESYREVIDFEAARESGNLDRIYPLVGSGDFGYQGYVEDVYRRFAANALSFTIGPGRPLSRADVTASDWINLQKWTVPGTPHIFTVTHPDSTDPALAAEIVVAFEYRDVTIDPWGLMLIKAAPYPLVK